MDTTTLWLKPRTREGRVWIRTPQGTANIAGLFIRKANPKNQKTGNGDFCSFTGLYCSLKFSQPPSQMHSRLAFAEGQRLSPCLKGKDFCLTCSMPFKINVVLYHKVRPGVNLDEGLEVQLRNTCFSGALTIPYLTC